MFPPLCVFFSFWQSFTVSSRETRLRFFDAKVNTMVDKLSRKILEASQRNIGMKDLSDIYQMARDDALFFKGLDTKLQDLLARNFMPEKKEIFEGKNILIQLMSISVDDADSGEFFCLLVDQ
jgi:hypothetical protein